jgi:glycosyltransferase involved in cell wall biosynthesis
VEHLARDHRVTGGAVAYMRWLYGQASCVFARSNAYRFSLRDLGVAEGRIATLPAGVDGETFHRGRREPALWQRLGVTEPLRVLYCGRVSVEKNLPILVEAFKNVCGRRRDVALVVAGDGPNLGEMRAGLAGLPAYFLGYQDDGQLPGLYASADLLAFPSRTDTLGQVVMEAQACGLPALVAHEGGPKEVVADGTTGLVLPGGDAKRWAEAMVELLDDVPRRQRMGRAAAARAERFSLSRSFEAFWAAHAAAVAGPQAAEDEVVVLPPSPRWRLPVG